MNIGNLTRDAKTGAPVGRVTTMNFTALIALQEVRSSNSRAPAFDVLALSVDRRSWVKVGALWAYTRNDTGEVFYSGRVDDPSMTKPLEIAVFEQEDETFNVTWRRPKQRAATPKPGSAESEGEDTLPALPGDDAGAPATGETSTSTAGDNLGESTAPAPAAKGRGRREPADA